MIHLITVDISALKSSEKNCGYHFQFLIMTCLIARSDFFKIKIYVPMINYITWQQNCNFSSSSIKQERDNTTENGIQPNLGLKVKENKQTWDSAATFVLNKVQTVKMVKSQAKNGDQGSRVLSTIFIFFLLSIFHH